MRRFILILALLFVTKNIFGQSPHSPFSFRQLIDDKGALSNISYCFLKDRDGFLWIGTGDGLKRYDGHDFKVFKHEATKSNTLINNDVETLCEDKFGRIWIGTGEGIGYFDKKSNQFSNLKGFDKSENVCFTIVCDEEGDIWFTIRGRGLFHYIEKTKKVVNFTHNDADKRSISSNKIRQKGVLFDPAKNGIWVDTTNGINFFDFATQQFYHKENNPQNLAILQSDYFQGLAIDRGNLIFFDKEAQKLKYFSLAKQQIIREVFLKNNQARPINIQCIFVDNKHNLWLSDWNSFCYHFDTKTTNFFELAYDASKPTSISSTFFWCAFQQKDGNIWLGTDNGISIVNPDRDFYEIYDIASLFTPLKARNWVYTFREDLTDSTWWLAVDTQRFAHYNPTTNQLAVYTIPNQDPNAVQFIQSFIDHQNQLYIVTTKAFHLFDKQTKRFTTIALPDKLTDENPILNTVQRGEEVWFFCSNAKAYCYQISSKKWSKYPILTNIENGIYSTIVDNDGGIWMATHLGLCKFSVQKQAFELIKVLKSSATLDFSRTEHPVLQKDKVGNLWIGTYNLIKFNIKTSTFQPIMPINIINDIIVDKEGKVWVGTYNDFTVFNPKIQRIVKETIPFNLGNLHWKTLFFSLQNGQLVSLMKGCVVKIDPNKIISPSTKDKVLISKIQLINNEVLLHNTTDELNLKSAENSFSVHFSTLNPPAEHKYKFSYQLSGYDKNWIATANHNVAFANLDGANYVFNVKGIDKNGAETAISSLKIHIDTIFYKTWWFLGFILMDILALIYAFYRYRLHQNAKVLTLQMKTTRLEKNNTEIQYQNLINHLNPHFLFNSLTSLNSLISINPKEASQFLRRLSLIYRYILQNKDKELVSLEEEIAFAQHYIELQKSRFDEGLQIEIGIQEETQKLKIVPVTLQNLLENAIKHNIIDEENPLVITIFTEDNYLIVENILQKKRYIDTSNKQGLASLKSLYHYLTNRTLVAEEIDGKFVVKVPLL